MFYLQTKFQHLIFEHCVKKRDLEIQMDGQTRDYSYYVTGIKNYE